jgi:hypothetical protein
MVLMSGRVPIAFLALASIAICAHSAGAAEAKMEISDKKGEISSFQTGVKSCLSGGIKLSEGGHRWTVALNNACGRVLQCNVTVALKANNGQTGSGSCNPSVPPGNNANVCSAYNANIVWVSGNGNAQCQ